MFLPQFLTAAVVALLLVLLFSLILDRRGPWSGPGWFFLILFLGAWAVGSWSAPVGPLAFGVAWVPFLFGAFAFALLLAALSRPRRRGRALVIPAEPPPEEEPLAVDIFLWIFIGVMAVAIIAGLMA